ncbi:MAG: HupE/UreJ family protein [Pseudomonadota bacterium]
MLFLIALLGLLLSSNGGADVFRGAELRVAAATDPQVLVFETRLPVGIDVSARPRWPDGCRVTNEQHRTLGERQLLTFEVTCSVSPWQPGMAITLPWAVDGARLLRRQQGRILTTALRPRNGTITVPLGDDGAQVAGVASLGEGLWQGMVHIAIGWDHLSFVLLICLLVPARQLLFLITAFTLGHSASLALAFYEVLHLPIGPVEATIALSIVLLAREVLLPRERTDHMLRPFLVITCFGLLHGLGFASALEALGVSSTTRWPVLLGFNLGVEIGQLLFVGLILALLALCRWLDLATPARQVLSFSTGGLGAFWLIERLLSLG